MITSHNFANFSLHIAYNIKTLNFLRKYLYKKKEKWIALLHKLRSTYIFYTSSYHFTFSKVKYIS